MMTWLGKWNRISAQNIALKIDIVIRELDNIRLYRYSGIDETTKKQHIQMKYKFKREYYKQLHLLNTGLISKNTIIRITRWPFKS